MAATLEGLSQGKAGISCGSRNRSGRKRMEPGGTAPKASVGANLLHVVVDFAERRPVCAFLVSSPVFALVIAQAVYWLTGVQTLPRLGLAMIWQVLGPG